MRKVKCESPRLLRLAGQTSCTGKCDRDFGTGAQDSPGRLIGGPVQFPVPVSAALVASGSAAPYCSHVH